VRLDGRLKRLEERASASTGSRSPHYELESYFRALEELQRKKRASATYTEQDRQDDEEFLRETLPFYRTNPGWQTEEGQRILSEWEKHTMHNLENGA
jgi:hypothetical protein